MNYNNPSATSVKQTIRKTHKTNTQWDGLSLAEQTAAETKPCHNIFLYIEIQQLGQRVDINNCGFYRKRYGNIIKNTTALLSS